MMNIQQLRQAIESIDEIKVIGKDFEYEDVKYHFMGLVRKDRTVSAIILAYDEVLREKREEEKERLLESFDLDNEKILTVREEERLSINNAERYLSLRKITDDENEILIGSSTGGSPSYREAEYLSLFTEFIKNGWSAGELEYINFDYFFAGIYDFAEEYSGIPEIDFSEAQLEFVSAIKSELTEIPLSLKIGGEPFEVKLPDGETVYFEAVSLADMREQMNETFSSDRLKQMLSPEQIIEMKNNFEKEFSKACPVGKCYVSVEYECSKETTLRIYKKDFLDNPRKPKDSAMAFIFKSDREPKREGLFLKSALIDDPFEADTKSVEAEIFSVQKIPENIIIKI